MTVVKLPELLKESDAAKILGVHAITLKRERDAGRIAFTRVGQRGVRYTEQQLAEYLERCTCQEKKTDGNIEAIGSPNVRTVHSGAAPGSMPTPNKRNARASALTTFRRLKTG